MDLFFQVKLFKILFIFTHVYTFFRPLPYPPILPGRTGSALLFSDFVEKKT
jgi:hypothetical protein